MIGKLLILATLLVGHCVLAKTPDQLVEGLFRGLKAGEIAQATESFLSANSNSVNNESSRLQFEKYFGDLIDMAGEFHGSELLKRKRIGSTVEGRVYLLNHAKKPVQMTVVFYRVGKRWAVKHMHLNEKYAETIVEALKRESP